MPAEQLQRASQGSDTLAQIQEDLECESESSPKLHYLRLQLLEKLVEFLPRLQNAQGVRAIPFFQVNKIATFSYLDLAKIVCFM